MFGNDKDLELIDLHVVISIHVASNLRKTQSKDDGRESSSGNPMTINGKKSATMTFIDVGRNEAHCVKFIYVRSIENFESIPYLPLNATKSLVQSSASYTDDGFSALLLLDTLSGCE